jgi:hypothetical protein
MDFLRANAAAIQALGAIVTKAVTIALVAITWRYVALTQGLAVATEEQTRYLVADREVDGRQPFTGHPEQHFIAESYPASCL